MRSNVLSVCVQANREPFLRRRQEREGFTVRTTVHRQACGGKNAEGQRFPRPCSGNREWERLGNGQDHEGNEDKPVLVLISRRKSAPEGDEGAHACGERDGKAVEIT
jgi:hypothetical protein